MPPKMVRSPIFRHLGIFILVPAMLFVSLSGCGGSGGNIVSDPGDVQEGVASYYAHKFHGRTTASGEIYDETKLTAAHRHLPFGTRVRVTNLENGRKVVLRITDRGPFVEGRIIDVSFRAAEDLGFVSAGLVRVRVQVLDQDGGL